MPVAAYDQPASRRTRKDPHHQQRYQPFRFFQEQAMGKEDGIFEETEPLPLGYELKISIKLERA